MNATSTGWILFIAAVGSMCTLSAVEVANLPTWDAAVRPAFVGLLMAHLGTVITAFIGGKLIPADRDPQDRTRASDPIQVKKEIV